MKSRWVSLTSLAEGLSRGGISPQSRMTHLDCFVRCGVSITIYVCADVVHWYLATLSLSFWNKASNNSCIKNHTVDPAITQQVSLIGPCLGCDDQNERV